MPTIRRRQPSAHRRLMQALVVLRCSLPALSLLPVLPLLLSLLSLPVAHAQNIMQNNPQSTVPPVTAGTDIAMAPLRFIAASVVKPNLYFILDDSGSMQWSYLGDEVADHGYENAIGYRSSACNKIYYNPAISYPLPVDSTGKTYAPQNFNAALYDGFQPASLRVDLGSGFMPWRSTNSQPPTPESTATVRYTWDCWSQAGFCTPDQGLPNQPGPAHYYVYTGSQPERLGDNTAADPCKDASDLPGSVGAARWRKVLVGATSGIDGRDERQNFANWFSYHRTRILMMKTAVGRAFMQFDARMRIGYSTTSDTTVDASRIGFLPIRDFDAAQRQAFYDKLYAVVPVSGTPLRGALAKAGQLYAGTLLHGAQDPVRYACQQNYTLLSTDGYWNTDGESATYGPRTLDGRSEVGNQDQHLPRPMFDGSPHANANPSAAARTNTLADVAAYYANTDLRQPRFGNCGTGTDLCENNAALPGRSADGHQRMITHTLGLGANGTLRYCDDYDTASDGDFRAIVDGKLDWPDPILKSGGERIDDLWHAAVNGGGRYFSARSPDTLARALGAAMSAIRAGSGAASSVATSSQQPVSGDDGLYAARYRSVYWDGELDAQRLVFTEGKLTVQPLWSASAQLDSRADHDSDTRVLLIPSATSANGLKPFRWSAMDAGEQAFFTGLCPGTAARRLTQCTTLPAAWQADAGGRQLVDYLRGQRAHEDRPDHALRLFRSREHLLGAVIHASPLYVGRPPFRYADDNYGEFRELVASERTPMVYLAANDGMLHAFHADTGDERWAFLPSAVLPSLWHVADSQWANDFHYLHDGTPVAGDICPSVPATACTANQWRTILIGALGAGGRAYYALDITQPEQPALLWQFDVSDDADVGLAMGRPIITKRRDGRWVVVLASGHANRSPGSGRGVVFVLDAWQGRVLSRIDTGAGSPAAPAGLAQLNAWIDSALDNTAERLYGADLLGNVWRVDIGTDGGGTAGTTATAGSTGMPGSATLLARLDHDSRPQAVTTRPELSLHRIGNRQFALVTVATGKLLGLSDLGDASVQSIYTFRDDLGSTGLGRLQGSPRMLKQVLATAGTDQRSIADVAIDWTRQDGWYVNLDTEAGSGERVTLDPEQQLGILRVIANVPDTAPCQPRARAWLYQFNVFSGSHLPLEADAVVARKLERIGMVSGANTIWIDGRSTLLLTDDGGQLATLPGALPPVAAGSVRRVSWRELD